MNFNFFNNFKVNDYVKRDQAVFLGYYKTYLDSHNSVFFSNPKIRAFSADGVPFVKVSQAYNLGHDLEAFNAFKSANKFMIDDSFLLIDPHRFRDPTDDDILYQPSVRLYQHGLLQRDEASMMEAVRVRFIEKSGKSDRTQSLQAILDDKNRAIRNSECNIVKIIPIQQYNDFFKGCGLENDYKHLGIHFLDTRTPNFLNESAVISEADILADKKDYDIILTGSNTPLIYPYRHIARCHLSGLKEEINILDQSNDFNVMMRDIHSLREMDTYSNAEQEINRVIYQYYNSYNSYIRSSKMGITCSNIFGYTARRYFEFMSNGCVVVGQMPRNSSRLGFKHMENVFECDVDDINEAVLFLKKNDDIRIRLALNARSLVLKHYTVEKTEAKLWDEIERIVQLY